MDLGNEVVVGMADMKQGVAPQVLTTVLGSCVGVCLYAPRRKAGGLLHVMMPASQNALASSAFKKEKFADTGTAELIRAVCASSGAGVSELEARIFGGAKIFGGARGTQRDIGRENADVIKNILKAKGIPLKAECLGGAKGYRIKFNLETGRVQCQVFGDQIEEF